MRCEADPCHIALTYPNPTGVRQDVVVAEDGNHREMGPHPMSADRRPCPSDAIGVRETVTASISFAARQSSRVRDE